MDLDELRQNLQAHDRKLDASLRLNAQMLRASTLGRAEAALKRLSWLLAVELVALLAAVISLGSFAARHAAELGFLAPAVVLGVCAIGFGIVAIRQLDAISRIDYSQPVLAVQKQLESLRLERLRAAMLALLLGPLLWVPLLIVVLQGLFGVDTYAIFSRAWLVANLLFGLLVLILAVWASRRYAERVERSVLLQRLMRDLAGYNLNKAAASLRELQQFDPEEPHRQA